jgi:hypothetical protein
MNSLVHNQYSEAGEIVVEQGKPLRDSTGPEAAAFAKLFNDTTTQVE